MAKKKSDKADKIAARLDELAHHLVDRILEGQADVVVEEEDEAVHSGKLPIRDETAAFVAVTKYYEMLLKREGPSNKGRPFNGHQDAIADIGRGRSASHGNGAATSEPDF